MTGLRCKKIEFKRRDVFREAPSYKNSKILSIVSKKGWGHFLGSILHTSMKIEVGKMSQILPFLS